VKRDAEFCLQPEFVAGVKMLAEFGFTFDLCVRPRTVAPAVELVARVPEVTFVLDHFGKPDVRGRKTEPWATDLKALAALPNVVCKISGLATRPIGADGSRRTWPSIFNGRWKASGSTASLFWRRTGRWQRWRRITCGGWKTVDNLFSFADHPERVKLFQTNAERIYRV